MTADSPFDLDAHPGKGLGGHPHGVSLPSPRATLLLVLVSLVLCVTAGTVLQLADLMMGIIGTEILCIMLPLAVAVRLAGCDAGETLKLRWPGWIPVALAAVMAPAAAIVAGEIFWIQGRIIPIPAWYLDAMENLVALGRGQDLWLGVLALSVLPAVGEESLFRGFVLSGLERRFGRVGALCLSGVLFGLIHVDIYRFTAVCLLGVFLGWVTLTSGSLYPAMVIHAINNALILISPERMERMDIQWLEGNESAPFLWMVAAVLVLAAGVVAMRKVERR
ncbi:MAG: CPBP family intramembrane metalloprotease [Candidatus Eisenbacteria sp.]|nr:CPBP family intramembrane metalloprotease [Candidatus Eisenbacteria bacterium]